MRWGSGTWGNRPRRRWRPHFGSLDALLAADEARLLEVPDVGPVVGPVDPTGSSTSRTIGR